jgi:hypothetical protein
MMYAVSSTDGRRPATRQDMRIFRCCTFSAEGGWRSGSIMAPWSAVRTGLGLARAHAEGDYRCQKGRAVSYRVARDELVYNLKQF